MTASNIFHLPEFIEEEQRRQAHIIVIACSVCIISLLVFIVYYGIISQLYNVLPMVVQFPLVLWAAYLTRRGAVDIAALLLTWSMLLGVFGLSLINDGLYDTALQVIPGVLIIAALLLQKRQLIILSLFSLSAVFAIAMLQAYQIIHTPPRSQNPMSDVFDIIIVDGATVILVMMVSFYLKETLMRLRQEKVHLSESEELFRSLYENTAIGLYRTTPDGRVLLANPALVKMLGYSSFTEFSSKNLEDEGFEPSYERKKFIDRIESEGVINGLESLWTRKDGTHVYIRESARALRDANGRTVYYDGTVEDISERKHMEEALRNSEERFKLSMEATNDGLWDWNIATDEGYFSPAYYLMLGYDPGTFSAEGKAWKDLIHPEDRAHTIRANEECIEGVRESFEVEYRMKARTGEWRWILGRGKCIARDAGGRATRLVGTHVDITERKVTEQLVRDMQRRESIGILSGGIAHDFNNLLGSMMGNVSLAQSHLPALHPAGANLKKAMSAMERATELTQQMLAYSGKGKFQIRAIDVGSVVLEHASLFNVSLPKNVTLSTHLPSAPVCVNGDPGQIEQVIMNLIINGGEAIGDKQGEVSISLAEVVLESGELAPYGKFTSVTLSPGPYAVLEVRDTGIGMSAETQNKIFDPFFTTKFIGRGLGLSAVLGIIQGHKGGLIVESSEGCGTTFRLILPAVDAPPPLPPAPAADTSSQPAERTAVLVIDDEEDVATMAQEMLEAGRYATMVALNPLTGIELYSQHARDIGVILLDLTMPDMSGKDVVDALHAIDEDVKIIITSGYSEDEVVKKLASATVSGFIQKPYRLQSLLALVKDVMREDAESAVNRE
jgi:PAS domain S-box-containing protein